MAQVSENMDMAAIRNTLKEFAKQMAIAEGKQDAMNDMFDMVENPNVAADADQAYNSILSEMSLEIQGNNVVAVKKIENKNQQSQLEESKEDEDL